MTLPAENCYLQSHEDPDWTIFLPHDEAVGIGRNLECMILDIEVSRNQLILKADYEKQTVRCLTSGMNFSGCNGYMLWKNCTYEFHHGDCLEVLLGTHFFNIIFEQPAPPSEVEKIVEAQPTTESKFEEPLPTPVVKKIVEPPPAKKPKLYYSIFEKEEEKPAIEPEKITGKWELIDRELLIYTPDKMIKSSRVAAFDMDGTIIKTKSGHRFPRDCTDWTPTFANVDRKLKELHEKRFKLVIFTNQSKLGQDRNLIPDFKEKIEVITSSFGVPFQVFIAIGKGIYRKPCPGMWNALLNFVDSANIEESFYVGDAAGREKNWAPHRHKDHSIADRLFAMNIGIKFYTPEEYFLGTNVVSHIMPEFDPRRVAPHDNEILLPPCQEVVVMVGSPASGKSFFCKRNLIPYGYIHINRDTLGSKQRCLQVMQKSLRDKLSVVIDNVNRDVESRKDYIEVARQYGVPCRCFYMAISKQHAKHNNKFRILTDKTHIPVGDIILHSYKKHFQEPSVNEGFAEVVRINFDPSFENPDHEALYRLFLLEY